MYAVRLAQSQDAARIAALEQELARLRAEKASQGHATDQQLRPENRGGSADNSAGRNPNPGSGRQGTDLANGPATRDGFKGPGAGESIEFIPLEEASAEKMVKLLKEMFEERGTFHADVASNSLIIRADAKTLDEARALIERLEKQAIMRKERTKARGNDNPM
jgi:type II secretory pathway component GspD/PulD (secretin)